MSQNERAETMGKRKSKDKKEQIEGFKCSHCKEWVTVNEFIGTSNRNHCHSCLWSKHVDLVKPGDRKSECQGGMEPIGLTFKQEGLDKYGKPKQGEIMIIHKCTHEGKISINRIAADDNPQLILEVLDQSKKLDAETKIKLEESRIKLLTEADKQEIKNQLFGIEPNHTLQFYL